MSVARLNKTISAKATPSMGLTSLNRKRKNKVVVLAKDKDTRQRSNNLVTKRSFDGKDDNGKLLDESKDAGGFRKNATLGCKSDLEKEITQLKLLNK
eukprot:CAMPEP_0168318072 /NCGR_PEP_ID=MMETSP0213-20121227/261_1 /TAXON_ID=151035 /ORGANISM="Euplotes harpa, Strain FSP1.4" /LENGTH=96 /DNA_ID=CAMNT_0008319069 /DNA_START=567 /DNA_END=857 /DNA_ORIENTATION=-